MGSDRPPQRVWSAAVTHTLTKPVIALVMGVSGSGKTTVSALLAAALGCQFHEGDDLHPRDNVEKMHCGTPLTDADRMAWLHKIAEEIDGWRAEAARKVYEECRIPIATPAERVRHVVDCAFAGRRIVIFSGGAAVFDDQKLLDEIRSIHAGRGFGSIIGLNSFQRPKNEALRMFGAVMDIYAATPDRTRTL
jgi:hypothetical protein